MLIRHVHIYLYKDTRYNHNINYQVYHTNIIRKSEEFNYKRRFVLY